jgi:tRNA A-37 threonylcarbamoyl transferase component Bud32
VPRETLAPRAAVKVREPQVVFALGEPGGGLTVNAEFVGLFTRLGLWTASAFLELPGEVVSGHPDRHVVRIKLPGTDRAFYLKRQHVVGWREKLRNWFAGFEWVSRCEREAAILQLLVAAELPAPRWAAFGAHRERSFLLVEEVPGALELREVLRAGRLAPPARAQLAANIGATVAAIHAAGFTTPDLSAKHILVNPETLAVTPIDWQSARVGPVSAPVRAEALGVLHASLAAGLASCAERLRVLRAYPDPTPTVTDVLRATVRHTQRRSVRDQLQSGAVQQRLVWLAGEVVCAVPPVAAVWPRPVVAPPFYDGGPPGRSNIRFAGRDAVLVRGRTRAPLGRLRAWLRAAPWRSPGATIGRTLFHLARYGVPAPQLLAFGQRRTSATTTEWFALYEAPRGMALRDWCRTASGVDRRALFGSVSECLDALHGAGCILRDAVSAFTVAGSRVVIADPMAVRIVRGVSARARERDRRRMARVLGVE